MAKLMIECVDCFDECVMIASVLRAGDRERERDRKRDRGGEREETAGDHLGKQS